MPPKQMQREIDPTLELYSHITGGQTIDMLSLWLQRVLDPIYYLETKGIKLRHSTVLNSSPARVKEIVENLIVYYIKTYVKVIDVYEDRSGRRVDMIRLANLLMDHKSISSFLQ